VALAVRIIIGDAIQVPTAKRMVFNTRAFTFVYNTDLCVCVCVVNSPRSTNLHIVHVLPCARARAHTPIP
jgi:hypothetical protein